MGNIPKLFVARPAQQKHTRTLAVKWAGCMFYACLHQFYKLVFSQSAFMCQIVTAAAQLDEVCKCLFHSFSPLFYLCVSRIKILAAHVNSKKLIRFFDIINYLKCKEFL